MRTYGLRPWELDDLWPVEIDALVRDLEAEDRAQKQAERDARR